MLLTKPLRELCCCLCIESVGLAVSRLYYLNLCATN
jgi:hypothetical protein